MFYEESQLSKLLTCKNFTCKLEDNRLLPCGRSICSKCIDFLQSLNENRIKCLSCAEIHDIPANGFPKNLELAELLELNASEVSRGALAEKFKMCH